MKRLTRTLAVATAVLAGGIGAAYAQAPQMLERPGSEKFREPEIEPQAA